MNDSTLLYAGMFCFVLTLLGLALTAYEFKKMSQLRARYATSAPKFTQ